MGEDQFNDLYQELDDEQDSRNHPSPSRHPFWIKLQLLLLLFPRGTLLVCIRRDHHLSVDPQCLRRWGLPFLGNTLYVLLVMQPARRQGQFRAFDIKRLRILVFLCPSRASEFNTAFYKLLYYLSMGRPVKHEVRLSAEEEQQLKVLTSKGKTNAR
ncbi:hypothetical protein, partial [Deinococcus xinjiangensis]|uniref:hypothetical protein n=1 Tax=Deinococcus xinjiangensis TaxID=457454 RepID=UPI00336572F8